MTLVLDNTNKTKNTIPNACNRNKVCNVFSENLRHVDMKIVLLQSSIK